MTGLLANERMFKRAVVFSAVFHALLFTVIAISPSMTKPVQKGMIHYVSLGGLSGGGGGGGTGGGGGGGGGPKAAVQPPVKKETLRDLAVPSKVKPEVKPSMTYPVDNLKKDKKGKDEKKAAITRPQPNLPGAQAEKTAAPDSTAGAGQGAGPGGSGLRIGLGEGPGGGGFGSEYGDQIGLSGFPYQYYLQIISDRVSSSWFTSLVDPGVSGTFFASVYFKILRNGQVVDLKVKESSGIQSLDMSAQRAIQISAPFPPLPSDYEGDYLGIHLIFEHSK
jgi:TonB family protein